MHKPSNNNKQQQQAQSLTDVRYDALRMAAHLPAYVIQKSWDTSVSSLPARCSRICSAHFR